jgi:hypothetical protein
VNGTVTWPKLITVLGVVIGSVTGTGWQVMAQHKEGVHKNALREAEYLRDMVDMKDDIKEIKRLIEGLRSDTVRR